mmetsp:Transcript_81755/g.149837  ORF Transcript_81755/g.149837 Transcript_81755/m.149837 type:complete len:676 (-) Transcript_81755:37-2064(-)
MALDRRLCLVLLVTMLGVPAQSLSVSTTSSEAGIQPVINMLKDMLKTMQKEAEEDEEIYDKLACWCDTNEKEKTKAIAAAEKSIDHLTSSVEELTANSAQLTEEIANLEKEKTENQAALDKATALQQKDLAEFTAEEKDMVQTISALNSAISVLSKHHSSLLQMPGGRISGVAATLRQQLEKHSKLLEAVLTPVERKAVASFTQEPSYSAQSGQIFGILTTMKETFESNLAASQKESSEGTKSYSELKEAKEAEIAAGTDQIDEKSQELAASNTKLAEDKQAIIDTTATLKADEEFLAMLQDKCQVTDREWELRQKARAGEMEAVSKALAVLTTDESHFTFSATFKASLVQKDASKHSERRLQASKVVAAIAQKVRNPRLAALSIRIRLDAFTRVKKAIDDMVTQLVKEKEDEIKHKDWCVSEFSLNDKDTVTKEKEKADLTAEIEDLESDIKTLTEEIETLNAEVAEMQKQIKIAGEDREKENKEFSVILADQRLTQKILKKALTVLKNWYDNATSFAQRQEQPAGPPPPPGFDEYESNEQSGGVMKLMKTLIDDAAKMEAETIRSEEDAQKSYEDFVKETNKGVEVKTKEAVTKKQTKAKAEEANVEAGKDLENANLELEQLANFKAELHTSCDYIMKNFDIRQSARDEEVEALKQAKAILSGAKFIQMLKTD